MVQRDVPVSLHGTSLSANDEPSRRLSSAVDAPVTFIPKRSFADFFGDISETIRSSFRKFARPVAAAMLGSTLLLGGCAMHGGRVADPPGVVQSQGIDYAQVESMLEAGDHDKAVELLREKLSTPKGRAELAAVNTVKQTALLMIMEAHAKNGATPVMGVFTDQATQTENGGKWDEDKNRAWTVTHLGPNGSVDLLLLCPVSGHAEDSYPDALYQQFTSYSTAPTNKFDRMRANAQIYSNNNSQYIYLTEDPSSYQIGKIVVADVKANGRYVTPVRVHLEGLEPGKTYEVRWSPYVGSDPNNPTVHFAGFKNGRTFRLIVPAHVAQR